MALLKVYYNIYVKHLSQQAICSPLEFFQIGLHNYSGFLLTGDLPNRLCTAADLKFYFSNFIASRGTATTYLKPNRNCNITTWVSGCEPGWACSVGLNQRVDFTDSLEMPARTLDCQSCCEGFFCPQGLTCMIRKYRLNLYIIFL